MNTARIEFLDNASNRSRGELCSFKRNFELAEHGFDAPASGIEGADALCRPGRRKIGQEELGFTLGIDARPPRSTAHADMPDPDLLVGNSDVDRRIADPPGLEGAELAPSTFPSGNAQDISAARGVYGSEHFTSLISAISKQNIIVLEMVQELLGGVSLAAIPWQDNASDWQARECVGEYHQQNLWSLHAVALRSNAMETKDFAQVRGVGCGDPGSIDSHHAVTANARHIVIQSPSRGMMDGRPQLIEHGVGQFLSRAAKGAGGWSFCPAQHGSDGGEHDPEHGFIAGSHPCGGHGEEADHRSSRRHNASLSFEPIRLRSKNRRANVVEEGGACGRAHARGAPSGRKIFSLKMSTTILATASYNMVLEQWHWSGYRLWRIPRFEH